MPLKTHIITAAIACLIVLASVMGYQKVIRAWNDPSTFMVVSVSVPDHATGDDPVVNFSREIFREMRGVWTVEIRRINSNGELCHGTGAAIYSPKEFTELPLNLSVYSGVTCVLSPGRYLMVTRWDLTDENGGFAVVKNITMPFTVSASTDGGKDHE